VLEKFFYHIWYGKKGLWWCLLWPLSMIYKVVISIRKLCYKTGIFKMYRAPCKVVIVGNQTVGGGGKTPMVIALATLLQKQGRNVGVICKGYQGSLTKQPQLVDLNNHTAEQVGDEAILLKQKVTCAVVAAQNRVEGAKFLLEKYPECEVIISDDGLTHLALVRDLEIIVENDQTGLGNGSLLPAGPMRDVRLKENDKRLFVASTTKSHSPFEGESTSLISERGKSRYVIYRAPGKIVNLSTRQEIELKELKQKQLTAVAAIAHPENFFCTLRSMGLKFTETPYPDHYHFQASDFNDDVIYIMTEKDAVKCADIGRNSLFVLPLNLELSDPLKAKLATF
jgi:tetraacyldisaccharide 4'-kinase